MKDLEIHMNSWKEALEGEINNQLETKMNLKDFHEEISKENLVASI